MLEYYQRSSEWKYRHSFEVSVVSGLTFLSDSFSRTHGRLSRDSRPSWAMRFPPRHTRRALANSKMERFTYSRSPVSAQPFTVLLRLPASLMIRNFPRICALNSVEILEMRSLKSVFPTNSAYPIVLCTLLLSGSNNR
jgi:hypothetical protein